MGYCKILIVPYYNYNKARREYNLKVIASNGKTVAYSNQGYTSRRDAVRGAATLRKVIREAFIEGGRA